MKPLLEAGNFLVALATNPSEIFGDGVTGKEPVFDVALMKKAAEKELDKLKSLPEFDLSTEAGRMQLRAAVKPVKQIFDDFETNIKVVKKSMSDIPKKCDLVSKALRDLAEPAIAKALSPFAELKAQEALTERWWKKEGIPFDKYGLERLMRETADAKPLPYSTEEEDADFHQRKGEHLKALDDALRAIYAAEKAEKEEKERLRQQAEEQARIAKEQRERQAAIDAEERKIAEEKAAVAKAAAELEEKQRAAVNPASETPTKAEPCFAGAPPADSAVSEWHKEVMESEAQEALQALVANGDETDSLSLATNIIGAIKAGFIPHVRFFYE